MPAPAFPIPVLALTMCAFCIGTAEFVVMGLLPEVARDLGVSIPLAGQLVTGYAMGVVVGAPILALATSGLPRKRVLLLMIAIFILGNLLSALAPNYALLLIARIVAAFAHGTMFGVGAVVAADLVPPNRRASAIGLMFTGLTLANILGVPLGTLVGQALGWRATFWAITALGVVALLPVALLIPEMKARASAGLAHEFAVLRRTGVLLALATTVFASASMFTFFTYIVPILREVTGFGPSSITWILFLIGLGLTAGITSGGRFADRGLLRTLIVIFAALTVLLAIMPLAVEHRAATLVVVFLWAIASFAAVPALQTRVVDEAKEAPNLASSLNIAAFNLGNAAGAFLGGIVIDQGFSLRAVPFAAAIVAFVALLSVWFAAIRDRRTAIAA